MLFPGEASFYLKDAPEVAYRGVIEENLDAGTTVELTPALKSAGDELVCMVKVVKHHGEDDVPFEVKKPR